MPNIKSAKKRVLVAKAANDINKANKSLLKTNVKKFEVAAASGDKEAAAVAAKVAIATIDKSVGKAALVGESAVPCNLQSATAGMNSRPRSDLYCLTYTSGDEESVPRNGIP